MSRLFISLTLALNLMLAPLASAQDHSPRKLASSFYYSDYLRQQEFYEKHLVAPATRKNSSPAELPGAAPEYLSYHDPVKDKGYLNWVFISIAAASIAYIFIKRA